MIETTESTAGMSAKDVRYATWVTLFAWIFAVYDFILFGTLLPEIGRHEGWSTAFQAELATWIAVGTAVIALLVGPAVDRMGRRNGIILTVSGAAVCSALTAVGGGLGSLVLVLIRSLGGFGYAEQTVNATYLSELYASAPASVARRRGFLYSLVQGGWPIGALLAAALTAILLPHIGWQGCFIFAALPSLVIVVFARKLKESPQFVAHRLKHAQATAQNRDLHGLRGTLQGPTRRTTLVLGAAFLLNWFGIQVFSVLGTTVITDVHHVSFENSLVVLILSNLVGYIGYLAFGFLGDRIGRRNAIALGWTISGLLFTAMLYAPHSLGPVMALYSLGLFFLIGPYAALLFFIGESFPTTIRATGGALVAAMGPIGAILAGLGATYLLNSGATWQLAAFYFGAVPCFVSGLLICGAPKASPQDVPSPELGDVKESLA
ncbi:MFS transporter [Mesorhizobium sp. SP-1A]|uniref:MFS transporter n=1 Tax=Mesorhizobium sp. SP-1A TaxID=3077840 RepID=UPI0028F6F9D4|nr:MFS transporter [Mesorhizobium sp. SP-1A]